MGEYLDPVVMSFVFTTAGVALAAALFDVFLILRHKGTARLAGFNPQWIVSWSSPDLW